MNLSQNKITFLKDVPSYLYINKTKRWYYHNFEDLTINQISEFIKLIYDDKIYMIIPMFANSQDISTATLNLSEPFLVNNRSNSRLIIKFIVDQWVSSGFDLKLDTRLHFAIKMKEVTINYKK